MKKIVVTGGHLTPALALINELENLQKKAIADIKIHFFGRKFATEGSRNLSAEYLIITQKKIKFYEITTGRLQRKFTRQTLPSLLKIPFGILQSFVYLLRLRPNLIVSFGGYLSLPVVFAGWLLGVPAITHEQAVKPGLATQINSLFAKKVYLSWPQTLKYFPSVKSQVIGNLVRKQIFQTEAQSTSICQFLKTAKKLIYVTGGNLGSHVLNRVIFDALKNLSGFSILHQVGTANYEGDLEMAARIKMKNYLAVSFVDSEDIGAVFNKAMLVISRAGANTVWELAVLGKPAILVPLPIAAGGEQEANAAILQKVGSAIIISQKDLTVSQLLQAIAKLTAHLSKYSKLANRFCEALPQDAAERLVSDILKYV